MMLSVSQRRQVSIYFHPILIGVYAVLYLLASNINQMSPAAALRVGGMVLAGSLLLYAILRLILRDTGRSALLASFWLMLLFAYGHVYELVEGKAWGGFTYGKHRYLIAVWLVIFLAGSWWLLRKLKVVLPLNRILNIVSVALLVFPLLQIGQFVYQSQRASAGSSTAVGCAQGTTAGCAVTTEEGTATPDIYYIILDGYSRADVLEKLYNLDITPFMDEMRAMGFVFPECTQSNYAITPFSMFASLNMDYVQGYPDIFYQGSSLDQVQTVGISRYIHSSQVRQFLEERGYQTIAFETDYWWLNLTDADLYIVGNDNPLIKYSKSYEISNFEEMFIRTTALRILSETNQRFSRQLTKQIRTPDERRYAVTRFVLEEVEKVPELPGKKFVYFHLVAPHPPYVFDQGGNFVEYDSRNGDDPAYPNEIIYLNKRVTALARRLIEKSTTPPIIIIQADHGWDPRYRLQILNAYYLPGGGDTMLYPEITPVNTFRLVFNYYFGAQYELQEDASYFSHVLAYPQYGIKARPYQLTPVPGSCMGK